MLQYISAIVGMFTNKLLRKMSQESTNTVLTRAFQSSCVASGSMWSTLTPSAPDKILKLTAMFKADTNPQKINVGAGTYKDDNGKPVVLEAVKRASAAIQDMDHEYAPIEGVQSFIDTSCGLVYGDKNELVTKQGKHLAAVQTLSGTGGCRVIFELLALLSNSSNLNTPGAPTVFVPNPTWANHNNIIRCAGLQSHTYRYYDAATNTLDIEGLLTDLRTIKDGSYILLHACAHNPTGMLSTMLEIWHSYIHMRIFLDLCRYRPHQRAVEANI